ncbi:TadE/TadG family type IV pilus assembly protein [Pigmentiphaga aceris]|uniref:TadE/TadG family type IV pilus assembly protein n=1 Tax=Pigmentiphaga aceris TaxID=1940612 RepID=UPI001651F24D|nr:TadE/TadG family type IV pilus assembly protein [Pigmentiphaga aceris]
MQRYVKVQRAVPLEPVRVWTRGGSASRARQRGAYAVEFAAVFLAFFLTFYSLLSWGLIVTARQSLQLAAEEAARGSLRYQAAGTDVLAQIRARLAEACTLADAASGWVSSLSGKNTSCKAVVSGTGLCGATTCCLSFDRNVSSGSGSGNGCQSPTSGWMVTVRINYDNYRSFPLIPVFPGFSAMLPAQLVAQATVWIPPTSLDRGV